MVDRLHQVDREPRGPDPPAALLVAHRRIDREVRRNRDRHEDVDSPSPTRRELHGGDEQHRAEDQRLHVAGAVALLLAGGAFLVDGWISILLSLGAVVFLVMAATLIEQRDNTYFGSQELQSAFLNQCRNCRDTVEEFDVLTRIIAQIARADPGVVRSRLIATQACRVAANGEEFIERVRRDVGLEIEVVCRERIPPSGG